MLIVVTVAILAQALSAMSRITPRITSASLNIVPSRRRERETERLTLTLMDVFENRMLKVGIVTEVTKINGGVFRISCLGPECCKTYALEIVVIAVVGGLITEMQVWCLDKSFEEDGSYIHLEDRELTNEFVNIHAGDSPENLDYLAYLLSKMMLKMISGVEFKDLTKPPLQTSNPFMEKVFKELEPFFMTHNVDYDRQYARPEKKNNAIVVYVPNEDGSFEVFRIRIYEVRSKEWCVLSLTPLCENESKIYPYPHAVPLFFRFTLENITSLPICDAVFGPHRINKLESWDSWSEEKQKYFRDRIEEQWKNQQHDD